MFQARLSAIYEPVLRSICAAAHERCGRLITAQISARGYDSVQKCQAGPGPGELQ